MKKNATRNQTKLKYLSIYYREKKRKNNGKTMEFMLWYNLLSDIQTYNGYTIYSTDVNLLQFPISYSFPSFSTSSQE